MSAITELVVGKMFRSFEDTENFMLRLKTECFLPLKILDSQTIANYNKTLKNHDKVFDDKWRFKHVKVVCCHNGVPRDRCGGKRPNQKVFPCHCPFFPCGLPTDCQIFHNFVDVRQTPKSPYVKRRHQHLSKEKVSKCFYFFV